MNYKEMQFINSSELLSSFIGFNQNVSAFFISFKKIVKMKIISIKIKFKLFVTMLLPIFPLYKKFNHERRGVNRYLR